MTMPCSTSTSTTTNFAVHHVVVGAAGKLVFSPGAINAGVGDLVKFEFLARNHTLTQSSLANPCLKSGQFDTGFREFNPKNSSEQYIVDYWVQDSGPQWFHCAQTVPKSHCQAGMVFAINPGERLNDFVSAATASSSVMSSLTQMTISPSTTYTASQSTEASTAISSATSQHSGISQGPLNTSVQTSNTTVSSLSTTNACAGNILWGILVVAPFFASL